jgi:hypothetical protein
MPAIASTGAMLLSGHQKRQLEVGLSEAFFDFSSY